ncbi:MAG: uncharacterized UPF0160 family protein [Planctomycetota bacterium]|jgi:uncharacterized UPF0160 family protein
MKNNQLQLPEKDPIICATHSGSFHADDVFAGAILQMICEQLGRTCEIIRTRDESLLAAADIVFDVGQQYDTETLRFDHHQQEGAGEHEVAPISYASCGLIWKHFSHYLVSGDDIALEIEKRIIIPVDAIDTGVSLSENKFDEYGVYAYSISHLIGDLKPTWRESNVSLLERYQQAVDIAEIALRRQITIVEDAVMASDIVQDIYEKTVDKRIIVLPMNYPWHRTLSAYPEPQFVLGPEKEKEGWRLRFIPKVLGQFPARAYLPESWWGLSGKELQDISGVGDATFCHRAGVFAGAGSLEGIQRMAEIALGTGE